MATNNGNLGEMIEASANGEKFVGTGHAIVQYSEEGMLEKVKRIQRDGGLTDEQMAALLGYSHRTGWAKIKCGQVPASESFELRAFRAFPEVRT